MWRMAKKAVNVLQKEGVIAFIKEALAYTKQKSRKEVKPHNLQYALFKIKNFKKDNLDGLVDFAFNDLAGLIKPLQVRDEILKLLRILDKKEIRAVLEIGTEMGGTLFLFSRIASKTLL